MKKSSKARWYFFSNIFQKAISFVTIPLFTFYLSTQEYGYLNNYNAWLNILLPILSCSLYMSIRGVQKEDQQFKEKNQSSVFVLAFIFWLINSIIVFVLSNFLNFHFNRNLLLILCINVFFLQTLNFYNQECLVEEYYKRYTLINCLYPTIALFITILILQKIPAKEGYFAVILPRIICLFAVSAVLIPFTLFRGKKLYDRSIWFSALKYCIPLIFHNISTIVLVQADRIVLSRMVGYSESGIYSFAYNVSLAAQVVTGTLDNIWIGAFSKLYKRESYDYINRVARKLAELCGMVLIIGVFVFPEIIKAISNRSYWGGLIYVPFIIWTVYINYLYTFAVALEYYERKTKIMAVSSSIAMAINIILNVMLIPLWGSMAAVCTTLISYLFLFAVHLIQAKKIDRKLYQIKYFSGLLIGFGISVFVFCTVYQHVFIRYAIAVIGIAVMFRFLEKNKEIIEILAGRKQIM